MKELNTFRKFINEGPDDIDILGKKFNFNDICPGAHKVISDLADEYGNNDIKLGDLLHLAKLHQNFFNLEKKALGPQGIDADELELIERLYIDINYFATNAFGADVTQEIDTYMKMHMDKIKKAGLKASEPGGSSDTSYAQDWADEQDAMYGKANFVEENDKVLDEILNEEKYEYVVTIEKNGKKTETLAYKSKEDADAKAKKINGGSMGKEFKATVSKDK